MFKIKKTQAKKRLDKQRAKPASVSIIVLFISSFALTYGIEMYLVSAFVLLSIAYAYYTGVMMDFITVNRTNMLIRRKKDPKYFDSIAVFYVFLIIMVNYLYILNYH